jgi:sarcosine oxidase gamma subunit
MSAASSEHPFVHPPRSTPAKAVKKNATPAEHRVQVAAARLRVTLDERLGRETPAKTKALAKEPI